MAETAEHWVLAEALREGVTAGPGVTNAELRRAALLRGAGGQPMAAPWDDLARLIGDASYRVTDAQVAAVREAAGSDKAAFEIVMAAAIGAGLRRWDAALKAVEAADDAAR